MQLKKEEIQSALHAGVCSVTFTKVNGDERDMMCTLRSDIVPAATKTDPITQKKVRNINEEVLPVYDIKAEGWRSFRLDKVVSFSCS